MLRGSHSHVVFKGHALGGCSWIEFACWDFFPDFHVASNNDLCKFSFYKEISLLVLNSLDFVPLVSKIIKLINIKTFERVIRIRSRFAYTTDESMLNIFALVWETTLWGCLSLFCKRISLSLSLQGIPENNSMIWFPTIAGFQVTKGWPWPTAGRSCWRWLVEEVKEILLLWTL